MLAKNGYQQFCEFPCLPTGANEEELQDAEAQLGAPLPGEYREFLKLSRYLKIDDGMEVGGLAHHGVSVAETPWISSSHRPGVEYLVFANYWRYSDGDQLAIDLSEPTQPVIAYLHEHGPLFEEFAPSFSFALWRLLHEDY
ncbi:MAG TPA: SMI1/KNR4 family protein [Pirellulales bacterium]